MALGLSCHHNSPLSEEQRGLGFDLVEGGWGGTDDHGSSRVAA